MINENNGLILAVDDNCGNLQILAEILEKSGYEVALAISGEEAINFVKNEKPDIILLDVMMPQTDGYMVARSIKDDTDNINIPIIFLSAKNESNDIVKGFECGGVDYVTKPFHKEELLARIKVHLELKRAREEILTLKGILPICSHCKSIKDDENRWIPLEQYIKKRSGANFTHGLCPDCAKNIYPDILS